MFLLEQESQKAVGTFIKDLINHINYIMYKVCFHYGLYLYVANKYHKSYFFDGKSSTFYLNILLKTKNINQGKGNTFAETCFCKNKNEFTRYCICAFGNFSNYHFYLNLVRSYAKIHFLLKYSYFMINETWVKAVFLIQHHACDGQYRINTQ